MGKALSVLTDVHRDGYAARQGAGVITFDSLGQRKEAVAAFAARCSMSIPFLFVPTMVDGRRVYDGGLRSNFPLTQYLAQEPRSNFIALYLGRPDNGNDRWFGLDLLNIVLEGEERQTVDRNRHSVVVIDTSPIGTVDFELTADEKDFLLLAGKSASLRFLFDRKLDDGPSLSEVEEAEAETEVTRKVVCAARTSARSRRFRLLLLFLALGVLAASLPFVSR